MFEDAPFRLTPDDLDALQAMLKECGTGPEATIPLLQAIQRRWRFLPREAVEYVAAHTGLSLSRLYGVSTFYSQFRHRGAGKHLIQVCHGTACHVAGAEGITQALRHHLSLHSEAEDTSPDNLFTLERVACLGCCTLAPVMLVDGLPYGHLTPDKAVESLGLFLKEEREGLHGGRRPFSATAPSPAGPDGEIRVALNSCCMASGSGEVVQAIEKTLAQQGRQAVIKPVGCTGICHRVPLIEVHRPDEKPAFYAKGDGENARRLVRRLFPQEKLSRRLWQSFEDIVDRLTRPEPFREVEPYDTNSGEGAAFLGPQLRIVTENCGETAPLELPDYGALRKGLEELDGEGIIAELEASGLRGRGGGGFPTGRKWRAVRQAAGEKRHVLCNGDEGDPGAFMDRMLLEAYPHRILEGVALGCLAVGADEGYLYIRAEYGLAVERVRQAIAQAEEAGYLGEDALGSGRRLRLSVKTGAGAFVCGEESGLIASLEGRRGMPRYRPPYPAEKGLWGLPTLVNNVETFGNVGWIIRNGAAAFRAIGTEGSAGTKVFALAGKVRRGGLIEVPMGTTIGEIVEEIGGGVKKDRRFKAVQLGGPSGGCLPAALGDTPVDFEAVQHTGAIMGSGGLVVLDDRDCMVEIARYFLEFTQAESCGRCVFCRVGTRRMLEMLERLTRGEAVLDDVKRLEDLGRQVKAGSLCGLGRTAPNPVLSVLQHFREEVEAHARGWCPAGRCAALTRVVITDRCIGCTLCARHCPTGAIVPRPRQRHQVEDGLCVRCGACRDICPEGAVETVAPLGVEL